MAAEIWSWVGPKRGKRPALVANPEFAFPERVIGPACASTYSRCLLGGQSPYGLHTRAVTAYRDTLTEGFSLFVTSIAAPVASGWSDCRVEFAATGERLCTARTQRPRACAALQP